MSAPQPYLPMLNGLTLGDASSSHDGVSCYPAIRKNTQEKYIVKVISVPSSPVQLDAMLIAGAFPNKGAALEYYMDVSRDILRETDILRQLSHQEGFVPYLDAQIVSSDDLSGYSIYLLGSFKQTLARILETETLTHKDIMQMSLDLCSALAACRREGYLYVDLKPENVFFSQEQGFCIGDVDFAALASLSYSSLPEKYRSPYTAPELLHEMAVLNDSVDVYSLGLMMYQAYNGGTLPDIPCGQPLPAPLYADYEFADIILKACHTDAGKRWRSPAELAQAIIDYIKKYSLSDEPIIPQINEPAAEESVDAEEFLPEVDADLLFSEMDEFDSDEYEEFRILSGVSQSAEQDPETADGMTSSDDLGQILAQADELIAHELPEPAVAPAPVDVPMPERIKIETEEISDDEILMEILSQEDDLPPEETIEEETAAEEHENVQKEQIPVSVKTEKKHRSAALNRRFPWKIMATVLLIIALISLTLGGYYYYDSVYLQKIDAMTLELNGNMLSVKVDTAVDHSSLTVVCFDSYGNTMRKNLTAGVAIFTDLDPQTRYSVHLETQGFHKLVGHISESFTTDPQTRIHELTAGIGNEDGSVLIRFETDDLINGEWVVSYSSTGIAEQQIAFQGNVVQISGLLIGAEYTFTLSRKDGQTLSGNTQIQYTASKILLAQNPCITACSNGSLTAQWEMPHDAKDILWTVRCYNASGFDQTVTTEDLTATFEGLEHDIACTVEITAEGMPKGVSATIEANPITVEQFHFNVTEDGMLSVLWDYSGTVTSGWTLQYSIDGSALQSLTLTENTAVLPLIPGGNYTITVTAVDATRQFGGACEYLCPEADAFQGGGITANNLHGALCIRPDGDNWSAAEIPEDQFVNAYTRGQKIGLVLRSDFEPEMSLEAVTILFVLRDTDGTLLHYGHIQVNWTDLWNGTLCQLDIPWLPEESGEYSVCLYFNGQIVTELTFSLSETQ